MGKNDTKVTVRYAGYIESKHQGFLNEILARRNAVIDESPFDGYTDIVVEDAFFGAGYGIASFPSLNDMYGKFMAGLDIDALYDQIFGQTINAAAVGNVVKTEAALLDDYIENTSLPRFKASKRNIGSVLSTAFLTGQAMIEDGAVKSLAKFDAELRYRLIPVAAERWRSHLDWNKATVLTYAEIMKLYYSVKMDVDEMNYSMAAQNLLWPFTVLDYERAAIGALQGAKTTKGRAGASQLQKSVSGALSGAAAGAMIGSVVPGIGTGAGALVGGAMGLAASFG